MYIIALAAGAVEMCVHVASHSDLLNHTNSFCFFKCADRFKLASLRCLVFIISDELMAQKLVRV